MGCTLDPSLLRNNAVLSVNLPGLTVGAVADSDSSAPVNGRPATSASSSVATVQLAGGLVAANAITAAAQTVWTGGTFSSTGGTSLVGLNVGGRAITVDPKPNTNISLPGLGQVILNRQTVTTTATGSELTVNAIVVNILDSNPFGLAVGTNIVIGHAQAGLAGPVIGMLAGRAFGTKLTVGGLVGAGSTAVVTLPCGGTDGAIIDNPTASVSTGLFTATGIASYGTGNVSAAGTNASTTDQIASVSLLPGVLGSLISASGITAEATASAAGGPATLSDAGSQFASLKVAGFPLLTANVAPNTTLSIPGVGTLYLHLVIETPNEIQVRMIELQLNLPLEGYAAGTDLVIASASAKAR
jgi:hypothetical protein